MLRRFLKPISPPRKVDFIICGTQKGGTTALYQHLQAHPDLCLSRRKEVHFFDHPERFKNPAAAYRRYHRQFRPKRPDQLLGEATPSYLYWPGSIQRMHQYNPALKPIVVLRNPIERAYSHWNMQRVKGVEPLSFSDAIRAEPDRVGQGDDYADRIFSYIDRGRYAQQLRHLWEYFPKEQTLILRSEVLKNQPADTLAEVCSFLLINPLPHVEPINAHARPYTSPLADADRTYLASLYRQEIKDLEAELDWDCSDWLD
ncbi:MAG: sulfotransferase domain-containing protein [Planctomycetota bacterium]